jgi:hypothetical protein
VWILAFSVLFCIAPAKAAQTPSGSLGGKFRQLEPRQQALVKRWADEYRAVFKRKLNIEELYNNLPLSARTTFQAVTHALLNTKLTSADGKPLGTALDLVDFIERISGQVPETRGDRQFRVYVYLKPGAVNKLYAAKEFIRGHDNTVYHHGYPMNFRQQGGAPSLQISVARTGRRADIDVDYRSSSPMKALVNGHLTSANSDVRSGNNQITHNRRWQGLSNWWKDLMALFVEKAAPVESEEGLAPGAELERRRIGRGPIHEAIHAYLTGWLVLRKPADLLPLFSIRAYPCVAEFGGDSRPDSKLALARILRRLDERNQSLGTVQRLEDVVHSVSYRLPDAVPVSHPYEKLFSLQEVPDDVAWAIDCRVRYKLRMAEAIPRPPHRLNKTYVASMRVNDPAEPAAFQVLTWKQEGGEWRVASFDLKHKTMAPPADLLAHADPMPAPDSDAGRLLAQAGKLLDVWLVQKKPAEAAKYFLPESYACDAFADALSPVRKPADSTDQRNLLLFLEEIVKHSLPNEQLEGVIAAAEAEHHEMKPLLHEHADAFLLVETSGGLLQMSGCTWDPQAARKPAAEVAAQGTGMATAFRLVHSEGEEKAAITLHWKKSQGEWRVHAYAVSVD